MRSAPRGLPHTKIEKVLENTHLAGWVSVGVERRVLPQYRWLHDFQTTQRIQICSLCGCRIFGYFWVSLQGRVHFNEKTQAWEHIWTNANGSSIFYRGHGKKAIRQKISGFVNIRNSVSQLNLIKIVTSPLMILEEFQFFWSLYLESLLHPWFFTTSPLLVNWEISWKNPWTVLVPANLKLTECGKPNYP